MPSSVSVVMPVHNAGTFIDASIGSALNQAGVEDLQVIAVDDGSTDDTAARLRAWNDSRLTVITQDRQGLAGALNTGVRAARGAYIAFLDADDVWLAGKLARHVRFHEEHPEIDVSFCWVRVIDTAGRPLGIPCPRWQGTVSLTQLLADYMFRTMSAVMIRSAAAAQAEGFDSSLVRCIDLEFFLRVALLRHDNIRAIPEVLTLYRRHPLQRTVDWRRMLEGWEQVMTSIRQRAPEAVAGVERLASSNMHRYCASLAYEAGNFGEAMELVRRGYALSPTAFLRDTRNWKMGAAALAGVVLPKRALFAIEKWAGFARST